MVLSRIRESPIQEQVILGHRCKKGFTKKLAGLSASSRVPSRLTCKKGFTKKLAGLSASSRVPSRLTLNQVSPDISVMSFRYKRISKKVARENE